MFRLRPKERRTRDAGGVDWKLSTARRRTCGAGSMNLTFCRGRQEGSVENVLGLGLCLEGIDQPDLIDRFSEPREIDGAKAVGSDFRRHDIVADGHAQAFEFHLP